MAADVTSSPSLINQISYVSYSVVFTGVPVGTFQVEVCDDAQLNADGSVVANTGSWTPLALSSVPAAAGSAGTGFIDVRGTAAAFIRLHYVATSGSGILNATVSGKVI